MIPRDISEYGANIFVLRKKFSIPSFRLQRRLDMNSVHSLHNVERPQDADG
jgi:hypothetical protein